MKFFNYNICLTSPTTIMVFVLALVSTLVIANALTEEVIIEETIPETEMWIPTKEDIKYQDSMFAIINQTQLEVDTIKVAIDEIIYKLERLEYADGTYDSIRIRR